MYEQLFYRTDQGECFYRCKKVNNKNTETHCVKSICIRKFLVHIFPHSDWKRRFTSVRMRKNTGQKNSKYGHFSRSDNEWNSCEVDQKNVAQYMKLV